MSIDHSLPRTRGRRRPLRAVRVRRRFPRPNRRAFVAVAVLAALLAGGWLWLRDSSLVRVSDVRVVGVTATADPKIRTALEVAARNMTTLHLRPDALHRAVAGYPSVASLRVRADFPHSLVIEVLERRPVAVIVSGSQHVSASGGGLLLRDVAAPATVPTIAADAPLGAGRVRGRSVLYALAVADAAPPQLRARTSRITWGPRGLTAELMDGPPLIFGDRSEAVAKWAAAARVLADPSAAGATYLDLRARGRVAAGGLGPVVDEAPATPTPGASATPTPYPQP